jgi:opacity protein-like surface antigen
MKSEHVGVGLDAAYHAWPGSYDANQAMVFAFGPGSDVTFNAIQTTGYLLYDFLPDGPARPYAKVGGGLYWVRTKLHTPFGDQGSTEPNYVYNLGAGVNFKVSRIRYVGIGAMYHKIQSTDFNTNLITFGANLLWGPGAR